MSQWRLVRGGGVKRRVDSLTSDLCFDQEFSLPTVTTPLRLGPT